MRLKLILGLFLGLLGGFVWATCDNTLTPSATSRFGLQVPQLNSCGWGTVTNNNWGILDSSAALQSGNNTLTGINTFSGTNVFSGTNNISGRFNFDQPFYLCDSGGLNCTAVYGTSTFNVFDNTNKFLWFTNGTILYQNSCLNGEVCHQYNDMAADGGIAGGMADFEFSPTLTANQPGANQMVGMLLNPTFVPNVTGVDFHSLSITPVVSTNVSVRTYGIDVEPISKSTAASTNFGLLVDMTNITSTNSHNVSGYFKGGSLYIVASTLTFSSIGGYSLAISTGDGNIFADTPQNLQVTVSTNGAIGFFSRTSSQIKGVIPTKVGEYFYCSDCATVSTCVSTGTLVNQWALITSKTSACQ